MRWGAEIKTYLPSRATVQCARATSGVHSRPYRRARVRRRIEPSSDPRLLRRPRCSARRRCCFGSLRSRGCKGVEPSEGGGHRGVSAGQAPTRGRTAGRTVGARRDVRGAGGLPASRAGRGRQQRIAGVSSTCIRPCSPRSAGAACTGSACTTRCLRREQRFREPRCTSWMRRLIAAPSSRSGLCRWRLTTRRTRWPHAFSPSSTCCTRGSSMRSVADASVSVTTVGYRVSPHWSRPRHSRWATT